MLRTLIPLACLLPALALAQTAGFPLRGRTLVVNNGPGDQTDPHVSGPVVAYTHQLSLGSSEIRVHDLATGQDQAIPSEGGVDSFADVSGDQVVFTRLTSSSRVFRFDVRKGGAAEELAPREGANRRAATIGGQTVAWQELGSTAGVQPEIFAYRTDSLALTRLSEDAVVDRTPAVSADGSAVAWTKCATSIDGCDIWAARAVEGGYEVAQLTGLEGEESLPDTNGEVVAYVTRRTVDGVVESDIAWQPVGGGEAQLLPLPGLDTNPNVSGPIIAFERRDASSESPNFDIVLYDLRTQTFYQLTETPESESLNDISVGPDGMVRVVWSVRENGDLNVYAYSFRLPPTECTPSPIIESPADVCDLPGTRPLLGSLRVTRSTGEPEVFSTQFKSNGTGVLCVDNGYEGKPATAGWVWLGMGLSVGPEDFGHDVKSLARVVPLQGEMTLSAQVAGAPGSAFQVRVYGEPACELPPDDAAKGAEARHGQFVPFEPMEPGLAKTILSRYFVPSGYEGKPESPSGGAGTGGVGQEEPPAAGGAAPGVEPGLGGEGATPPMGCSAGGGPVSLFGLWMLAASLFRHRASRARSRASGASRQ